MNPQAWQEISPYLDEALELTSADRAVWLQELRARNPGLALQLAELLHEFDEMESSDFLASGPRAMPAQAPTANDEVGAYRLLEPIGQGGMGTVWLAERSDGRFQRHVALKFPAVLLSAAAEQRFLREGSLLARLDHPNIARLMDAGVTATGQPYLVIEYVEGEPIDCFCDRHKLEIEERLRLFQQVIGAVEHAHANLVVHRDIKPSNVLVTNDGQVKLLDFGIGKLLEDLPGADLVTQLTGAGGAGMTPAFAAPEQLTGGAISTATDVYALGGLLYRLLCGRHPAGRLPTSTAEAVHAAVDLEPLRPSASLNQAFEDGSDARSVASLRSTTVDRLRRNLHGDLDVILLKTLKKDPAERYRSAAALAEDLQRHLSHVPIRARPDSLGYRTSRFVRRNRTAVALACLAILAAAAGVAATLAQSRVARAERDFALRQLARAEAIDDLNRFVLSDAAPVGQPLLVSELLERAEQVVARSQLEDRERADLLIAVGEQYAALDQGEQAVRTLSAAYDLSRHLEDHSVRARAACALAASLSRGIDLPRAETLYQEGLRSADSGPRGALDRVYCQVFGSDVAREAGEMQEAILRARSAERALASAPLQPETLRSRSILTLAAAYTLSGQLREATATYQQAAQLMAEFGRDNTQSAGSLYSDWGLALSLMGRPREAVDILHRAMEIGQDQRGEDSLSPVLLINYARTLRDAGSFDEATAYAEKAYRLAVELGLEGTVNHALLTRSRNYLAQGDTTRADAALDEAEQRLRQVLPEGHYAFGAVISQRGLSALLRGDPQKALALADEGIALIETSVAAGQGGAGTLPNLLSLRAEVQLALGRPQLAAEDASRALAAIERSTPPDTLTIGLGRIYVILARAQLGLGDRANAQLTLELAMEHLLDAAGPDHPDTLGAAALLAELTPGN